MSWQLAKARNKLSEVMTRALNAGPRRIRRRNQEVTVQSETDYQQLTGERQTLKDSLLNGPDLSDLDLTRDPSPVRQIR